MVGGEELEYVRGLGLAMVTRSDGLKAPGLIVNEVVYLVPIEGLALLSEEIIRLLRSLASTALEDIDEGPTQ